MQISRRSFLVSTTAMGATPVVRLDAQSSTARRVFRHGVASGDPLTDRVILWTRVTSVRAAPGVRWEVARDAAFTRPVASGLTQTGASRDFTVKVDAGPLAPGHKLFLDLDTSALGERSPRGTHADASATNHARRAKLLRSPTIGCVTPSADPTRTSRRFIVNTRSSSCGTTTRSRTTRGATARRTTSRIRRGRLRAAPGGRRPRLPGVDADPGRSTMRQPRIYPVVCVRRSGGSDHADTRLVDRDELAPKRESISVIDDPKRSLLGRAQEEWLVAELAA